MLSNTVPAEAEEKTEGPGNLDELPPALIAQATAAAGNESNPDQHAIVSPATQPVVSQSHQSSAEIPSRRVSQVPNAAGPSSSRSDVPIEQQPPPAYSDEYGEVDFQQDGFDTKAKVANDGRVNIKINQKSRRLSDLLVPALRSQLNTNLNEETPTHPSGYIPPSLGGHPGQDPPPPLNVVIHVVGSRGDVQPFVALGKVLKETYGHRVRLATHTTFRNFTEENGLEFFDIGGDPAELMAFMVKNPGLMPGMDSLRAGDVGKRRKGMYEIVQGCWRSCIEAGDGTGIRASDDNLDSRSSLDSGISMDTDPSAKPFVADAIIANPPSFAHIHCAEKLGIPLHLMFTMPWSPTQAFPHPLANVQSSNADPSITNFVSYALVEMMTWQGLGDIINRFRERSLGLEPVSLMWAPGMASRLRIPYTYCWSPALIPKPKDWGPHISISGFYFLSLASSFTPEPDLAVFLDAGPPPIYIGFGSIVVDDPNAMTKLIFEAVKKTGQRALVSKGWGGFGADEMGIPDGVFMLGNVPHDWLFKHVSAVVHHGGAGTTAAGIALGRPTVIVPFFGDQPFWGAMVAKAGAGPIPVPSKQLTADKLASAILEALKPTTLQRAQELGARISSEKGSDAGAQSFHDGLKVDSLRCAVAPSHAAVWRVKRTTVRLSAFAATTLGNEGLLDFNDLKLYRPREYDSEDGPWDPITGGASALLGTIGSLMMGVADFPIEALKLIKIAPKDNSVVESASTIERSNTMNSSKTSFESTKHLDKEFPPDESTEPMSPTSANSQSNQIPPLEGGAPLSAKPSRTKTCSSSAMASALRGSFSKSSSRSSSPVRRSSHTHKVEPPHRANTAPQVGAMPVEAALGAGKGVGRIVGAGLKSPMDFTLALARGFHNAPKLYGDESVRQSDKVTDFQSGLKVAGKEFGFGLYDGISGLVTQPLEGVKKEGFAGLIKGFGKGIGGVVLKPPAALWALPGYTFKGIYKEIQKHLGSSVQNYIVAARTAQGYDEWHRSNREERLDVVKKWHAIQLELAHEKHQARHGSFHGPQNFIKTQHLTHKEKQRLAGDKMEQKKEQKKARKGQRPAVGAIVPQTTQIMRAGGEDFEEAIRASIAATSRGNPDEDRVIEQAIRASVVELHAEGDNDDAMQRAIKASVAEVVRARKVQNASDHATAADDGADQYRELEEALHRSVENEERHPLTDADFDDSGVDTDYDENIKAAIHQSTVSSDNLKDEDLEQAIKLSKQAHGDHMEGLTHAKKEEEIVLDYVKRQSLVEEEHKKSKVSAGGADYESGDAEIKRATEESLQATR